MLDTYINLTDHSLHFRQFPPFQLLPSVRFELTTLGLPDQSLIHYATAAFTKMQQLIKLTCWRKDSTSIRCNFYG